MAYPFGYGLSYTGFEWSGFTGSYDEANDEFTFNVTVKNTGDVVGKGSVQLYMQSPYTAYDIENKVEKPSVQLVGFDKTQELAPGASETVEKRSAAKRCAPTTNSALVLIFWKQGSIISPLRQTRTRQSIIFSPKRKDRR